MSLEAEIVRENVHAREPASSSFCCDVRELAPEIVVIRGLTPENLGGWKGFCRVGMLPCED
jgi:hypothetical protein